MFVRNPMALFILFTWLELRTKKTPFSRRGEVGAPIGLRVFGGKLKSRLVSPTGDLHRATRFRAKRYTIHPFVCVTAFFVT